MRMPISRQIEKRKKQERKYGIINKKRGNPQNEHRTLLRREPADFRRRAAFLPQRLRRLRRGEKLFLIGPQELFLLPQNFRRRQTHILRRPEKPVP